jgi:dienelactone hydrolase
VRLGLCRRRPRGAILNRRSGPWNSRKVAALAFLAAIVPASGCARIATAPAPSERSEPASASGAPSSLVPEASADTSPVEASAADAAATLPRIPDDPLFTALIVPSFPMAVVSVPNGATSPRPLVIVLHGTSDRPDWNCDAWRHITGARGFVLCPSGDYDPRESTPTDRRFTLRGGAHLRAYLDAAIAALAARFAGYVDVDRPVVTGFSLGATEIAQFALRDPARYARVAQLEGGDGVWTAANVAAFASGGGRRVLFGCGSGWCRPAAKAAATRLERAGVEAHAVFAPVGHTNDRPLQEAIMRELAWFLDGDARWQD